MRRFNPIHRWCLLAMFLSITVTPVLFSNAAEQADWRRLSRWHEWQGNSGVDEFKMQTLVMNQLLEDRQITRIFAESSTSFRFILSEESFFRNGTRRLTLRDPQTGWWLDLVEDSGLKFDAAIQVADPGLFAIKFSQLIQRDYEGRMSWQAQGTPLFAESIRLWKDDAYIGFASRFVLEEGAGKLVENIPSADRQAIRSLASLLKFSEAGGNIERFRELLTALVMIIDDHEKSASREPRPPVDWQLMDTTFHYEEFLEDHERNLISTFKDVSSADPMVDLKKSLAPEMR